MSKRERVNYAALDYTQRLETIEDAKGETEGILPEWKEVRVADSCAQTLLKIHSLANVMRKLLDWKIECQHTHMSRKRKRIEARNAQ